MRRLVREFIPADYHDVMEEQIRRRRNGKSYRYEMVWAHKKGNRVITLISPKGLFDAHGRFIATFATITDITAMKRIANDLRDSEESFRLLADYAPIGISLMMPGRTFEYFNPPFVEMFGYDADDLPNKSTWFEKAYPDQRYRDHVMNAWSEYSVNVGDKGSLRSRRFIVCCKDGTEKHIHFRGSILGNGKHLMTYEDVTELVKAEEALRESEYRFKTVIESARDAIFMKDKDFQYTLINPAMAQWFNETVAGLTGKWDENFFDDRRSASSAKRI